MSTRNQKRLPYAILAIVVLSSVGCYYVLSSLLATPIPEPSERKIRVEFYDYQTEEPIEGLSVNLDLLIRRDEIFSGSAITEEDGVATIEIPSNSTLTLPVSISSISLSGIWVLEKIVGEREFTIVDEKWTAVHPQTIALNKSAYEFDEIDLLCKHSTSALTLESKLFLARGRILKLFNPIGEARKFDRRLSIDPLFSNFVEYKGINLAIVPFEEPLTVNVSLSYVDFFLTACISLDPGEKDFVDLTPSFVRSLSSCQVSSLKEMLDALEPYGFKLTNLYNRLRRVSTLYELGAQYFENQDMNRAMENLVMAGNLYRDVYFETVNTYTGTFRWTPALIVILIFFSFALSRMMTERGLLANVILAILLLLTFALFISTQPGFQFLISNLPFVFQKLGMPSFASFLIQFVQIVVILIIIVASLFTNLRDLASQTFGISMRNLRRRKMKTGLALLTIVVVSASAMCLLTFSSVKPTHHRPIYDLTPKVDNGLIVYKQVTVTTKPSPTGEDVSTRTVYYESFQSHEISWFLKDWVDSMNIYGIRTVRLYTLEGFTISDFSIFNLVTTDPYFMEKYLNASEVLGASRLDPTDRNMVSVGSKIASEYNLTTGSAVLLNDRRFIVKGIFNEQSVIENSKDLDGDSFLFQISDPVTREIKGGSFILGSINDFSVDELRIYKISIVAKSEHAENITVVAHEFLPLGFDFWETDQASFVSSYLMRVISEGFVLAIYSGEPTLALWGNWQNHIAPIAITAMLLVTNALGTVSERKSETRTVFTMGASPTRVRFIILLEGLVLGIVGGIFGYVFGYAFAQVSGFALPSLVQENMISGSPFTISFSIATFASLLGYLIPSELAVRSAVPSGKLSKKLKDIIEIKRGEVSVVVPMKLQLKEMRLFDDFLEYLVTDYSKTIYSEITMGKLSSKESMDGKIWRFVVSCAGGCVSDYQVSILAKVNVDVKVVIEPFDIGAGETSQWTSEHRYNLRRLSPLLREELLKFTAFKKG